MTTDVRPLPEPPSPGVPSAEGAPTGPPLGRVVVGVVIALVMLAAGLAVGRRVVRHDEAIDTTYRHVVAGLGPGWTAVAAKDEGVDTGPPSPDAYVVLLGTHDDPTRPAIELVWRVDDGAPTFDNLAASSGMRPLDTAGRATSCAPVNDGTTLCYVAERGRGLQVRANHVSLDQIADVVAALSFDADRPAVDAARLPADLRQLVGGRTAGLGLVASGNADHPSVASVLYAGPGSATALLVVGDGTRQELAYSGVFMQWERRTFRGRNYFVSTSGDGAYALWLAGRYAYWLRLSTEDIADLLAAAASVRPATDAEWTAIRPRPQWDDTPLFTG